MHYERLPTSSTKDNLDKVTDVAVSRKHETLDWQNAQSSGVYNHCLPRTFSLPTCGRLLAHCKDKVNAFREKMGVKLTIFKIGCTACPVTRFDMYRKQNFSTMWVLATSDSIDLIHMLEAALISEYHKHVGCKNKAGSGGDGALNRKPPADPPYFVYIAGGRADQAKWVG